MEFCPECENLMLVASCEQQIVMKCRCCENTKAVEGKHNFYAMVKGTEHPYFQTMRVNDYTIHDPTRPLLQDVYCPKCDLERNVIYTSSSTTTMKFLYQCTTCSTAWKVVNEGGSYVEKIVFVKSA